jgi:hypothetical protein
MAAYIKNDVQNILTNLRNKGALATTSTYHKIPRTTLRDRLNNARSYRDIYDDK